MFGLKTGIFYAWYREKRRAGLSGQPALKQMKVGPFPVSFLCNAGESIALFRINQILFSGQVKRFLHIFSGLVAGHRQVVQQIGARQAARRSPINDAVFPKITYQDVIEPEEVLTDCRPSSPTGSQRRDSSTNGHKKCALKRKKNFLGRNIRLFSTFPYAAFSP